MIMELTEELRTKIGEKILVFLKNSFRYEGKLLQILDGNFLQLHDIKSNKKKLISIGQIAEVEYG